MRLLEILLVLSSATTQSGDLSRDGQALLAPKNALGAAVGVSLAALAHSTHDNWRPELRGEWYIDRPSMATDVYGSGAFILPASAAMWAAGLLANQSTLQRTGRNLSRTLVLTQLVVGPIKLATQRKRPDGSDHYSFPSGHTANTFAVARYIQRDFGTAAAIVPYALATTTALGRMEGGRHFLSDVVMGASLGIIVGSTVGLGGADMSRATGLQIVPMANPGTGVRVVLPLR